MDNDIVPLSRSALKSVSTLPCTIRMLDDWAASRAAVRIEDRGANGLLPWSEHLLYLTRRNQVAAANATMEPYRNNTRQPLSRWASCTSCFPTTLPSR